MNDASKIVDALLETDIDPKAFLDKHADLGLDQAFVSHGWAIRSDGSYGKVNDDGDVRWIVYIEQNDQHRVWATFSGEKMIEAEHRRGVSRQWVDFPIDGEFLMQHGETADMFVETIQDHLCDKTGPEPDPEQEAYDDHFGYDDVDR